MSTSRPHTPAATSDTSDEDSLSDLDSGWTDLESKSNRSNGRHSPSTISEAGDSEDARSVIDRYDGEAWDGLTRQLDGHNEHDAGDVTIHVESPPAAQPSQQPRSIPELSELTLEDWVADAVGSSLLSDDETPTPHMSVHSSSSPLRLSFPDPCSNSTQDLLPSHAFSRVHSRSEDINHGGLSPARTESLSSVTAQSTSAATPSDTSFSVTDGDEERERAEETHHELSAIELGPPAASYALSIILLGHPPLPHLKHSTLSTLVDMLGTVLEGSPRALEGSDTARIHEVCIYANQVKSAEGPKAIYRIVIEDRTSGMSPSSSFTTLSCPTLALVFIQPPLSSPSLPSLPWNTQYLPLLLPSISDGFASSLLDLSPSVLFEHSVPDIPPSDNAGMKGFALIQCEEMEISRSRLDGSRGILTVGEFSGLPTDELSFALRKLLFSSKESTKEISQPEHVPENRIFSGLPTFRKPIVFISAFLLALLFGSTVFLRGTPSPTSQNNNDQNSSSQGQKVWSLFHPFMSRTPNAQASSSRTVSTVPEPAPSPPKSLVPASLKSFAVSVFQPEAANPQAASTSTGRGTLADKGKGKSKQAVRKADEDHHRPATIEPAAPHLTIDAPSAKSLSLLPQAQFPSLSKGKGKERASDLVPEAHDPFPSSITSLSTRITNALAPLFDRVQTDLKEIQEAIDALLQSLWRLQRQTSHGLSELVHVLSEHLQTGQGVQELAGKMKRVMRGEASKRHARARYNARKVRDISERYVSAARQKLKQGVDRARGNARTLKDGLASRRLERKETREHRRATRAKRARAGCKRKSRCTGYVFESVMALVV